MISFGLFINETVFMNVFSFRYSIFDKRQQYRHNKLQALVLQILSILIHYIGNDDRSLVILHVLLGFRTYKMKREAL